MPNSWPKKTKKQRHPEAQYLCHSLCFLSDDCSGVWDPQNRFRPSKVTVDFGDLGHGEQKNKPRLFSFRKEGVGLELPAGCWGSWGDFFFLCKKEVFF